MSEAPPTENGDVIAFLDTGAYQDAAGLELQRPHAVPRRSSSPAAGAPSSSGVKRSRKSLRAICLFGGGPRDERHRSCRLDGGRPRPFHPLLRLGARLHCAGTRRDQRLRSGDADGSCGRGDPYRGPETPLWRPARTPSIRRSRTVRCSCSGGSMRDTAISRSPSAMWTRRASALWVRNPPSPSATNSTIFEEFCVFSSRTNV